MHRFVAAAACFAISLAGSASSAQTIYPIDRAEILSGAQFDFKIEFSGLADPSKISVSLNGEDYAKAFGKTATFLEREDGKDQSALMLRDVSLTRPGSYKIHVTDGIQSREITWNVYGTPPRKAKNVILFIGDGMSPAHRIAARLLAKGIAEGKALAAHGTGRHRRQRFHHYRFRKFRQRLCHRPQIGGQCYGSLRGPHT
jgi:alkaline phosphatase